MTAIAYTRAGEGPVLLLIHGIGSRKEVWAPLLPYLTGHREVVSIDLPGFGASPLRPGQDLTVRGLTAAVVEFCAAIGAARPHVAGNSLGGWVALEMGRLGAVASVTGISPAGLWRGRVPRYTKWQVRGIHDMPARLDPVLAPLTRIAPLRMALTANVVGRPWRMPRQALLADAAAMVGAEGFERTLAATSGKRFTGGMVIDVPVTIAFGTRDVILGPGCRVREELPAHTRWLTPRGWGHLPMWDDPAGVAGVILEGSSRTAPAA
ncbi:MAG TPA: alpha/beta hydrolase [Sporichthyaceae bacterium]|jgi:pimeloyl-ACP methyl ester carboxylesterase|nr:alpha/beta hydrolase [Sporichthyaceae bacterium]